MPRSRPQRARVQTGALTATQAGRLAGVLYVMSGLVTAASLLLPAPPDIDRRGVLAVGLGATVLGLLLVRLPWHRWPRRASMALIPVAHLLIALHNHFGGADPYRYSLFFMVAFVWLGLAQRRGSSLLIAPSAAAAYIAPLVIADAAPWVLASVLYAIPVFVIAGEATAWVADRLMLSEGRFRSLIRNASDGIVVLDGDGAISFASPAAEQLLGHSESELIGRQGEDFLNPDDLAAAEEKLAAVMAAPGTVEAFELRMLARDGQWIWTQTTVSNLLDDPSVRGLLVNFRDITVNRQLQDQLAHQAFHDQLTGLANRRVLWDRMEHALARIARAKSPLSVLYIDLDGFKEVNDTFGHDAGDRVLVAVAERIAAVLRPADTLARIGGDEFGVVLEDTSGRDACGVARRVLLNLRDAVLLGGQQIPVTASIGVATTLESAASVDALLCDADVAMYTAKAMGGNEVLEFHAGIREETRGDRPQGESSTTPSVPSTVTT